MSKKVPEIRFKEFKGEWEEKRLGEVTKINQGLQIPISKRYISQVENSYFYITNEFLKENSNTKYYIKNPPKNVLCDENDILMTRTGNTGQVVTNVKGAFHNNFFKIKYDKSKIIKNYLVYFLNLTAVQNKILALAGSSTIPDLNHKDFYRLKIFLPTLPEQQKIADTFNTLDNLIEAHTKKLELLEEHKKGLLQKMFPRNGAKVPKIRFKEFKGEWEEKRLGDIATFYKGKGISKKDISSSGIECIRYGELYTIYNEIIRDICSKTNLDTNNLFLSKKNDVIIPSSGETQEDIATASCVLKDNVALGGDLNVIRTKENGVFLAYYLNSAKKTDIAKLSQGVSVIHLYNNQLKQLKLFLPTIPEQQKIADTLSSLDNLIEVQAKKIEALKSHKKGLMQKMFPNGE